MGDVVKIVFDREQQDLVGTLDYLCNEAMEGNIAAIAFAVQCEDGSYEMSWSGDVTFHSLLDALKTLTRAVRREIKKVDNGSD